ncbi:hypothetical protein T12_7614 [Trichinella patagoniensis]|uniref:Uncharacterized protein n=1 Tax=Trichinella patagoniensis TaxID=990121 RepID=A0A0V0Z765_9BILA|nr:hypothetical protein T12_7614 [Trichinella patagoniensis]
MASASVELLANAYRKTFCMLMVLHRIFKATTVTKCPVLNIILRISRKLNCLQAEILYTDLLLSRFYDCTCSKLIMELNIDSNDPLGYFDDCIFKKQ